MVRLSENQSKELLADHGIEVPAGMAATTPEEAREAAAEIDAPVVLKAQVSVTKRADRGLIRFVTSPEEAEAESADILGRSVEGEEVSTLRVEEQFDIADEWYAGTIIDTEDRTPTVIFSTVGGTGVESLTRDHPDRVVTENIPVSRDLRSYEAYDIVRQLDVHGERLRAMGGLVSTLGEIFRAYDARSVEINPVAVTDEGEVLALDARVSLDDATVSRHPEVDVDIARELGRSPTELERIAYDVEQGDYRGTFYFIQTELDSETVANGDNYVGFHGAGGGGSMMSLDAISRTGFETPNYTDTSGNPPASKIYKAARIILSQPGLVGYVYSGSGAASQEMYTIARGLMRAFIDEQLSIPVVLRLGGNGETEAIRIVDAYAGEIPAPIEAYGGEKSAQFCADRLEELVETNRRDPAEAKAMTETSQTPDDTEFDLEIDEELAVPGLEAYRERLLQNPAIAELTEVDHKWVF
jgi:succinyl-CoA synthetase beta subunit